MIGIIVYCNLLLGLCDNPNRTSGGAGEMQVLRASGGRMRIGTIGSTGDFTPTITGTLSDGPVLRPTGVSWIYNYYYDKINVYQFRSGMLISGVLECDVFTPDRNSRIVSFNSLTAQIDLDRWIYNHPDCSRSYWTKSRIDAAREKRDKLPMKTSETGGHNWNTARYKVQSVPINAEPPDGWKLIKFVDAYPNSFSPIGPLFVRVAGSVCEYGQIDSHGGFTPEYSLPVMARSAAPQPVAIADLANDKWVYTYNLPRYVDEEVYEYQSGNLIRGKLSKDGIFFPVADSFVTSLKSYRPSGGIRIYNLPGLLQKR